MLWTEVNLQSTASLLPLTIPCAATVRGLSRATVPDTLAPAVS